jgi:predicted component of type VI protein secretion system
MSKTLIKLAQKLAKDQDMIYAPDMEAMIWMQRFSEIVTVQERERCARKAEDWGLPDLAAAIREKDE